MKRMFLMFILSFSTMAIDHYVLTDSIADCSKSQIVYSGPMALSECSKQGDCTKIENGASYNCNYSKLQEFEEVEENSVSCLTDCDEEFEALECDDGFVKKKGLISVYCYKEILEKVVVDEDLKATFDTAQATAQADADAMALVMANMECGKKAVARMTLINSTKSFDETQVATFVSTYSDIKQLLETGALGTAIQAIQAVTADGTIVTEADKTALVDQINSCKQ